MDLQQQVNNIASKGRYGDSMLMHVNPIEVEALKQVMPITTNPDTGQPEAFAPLLLAAAPMIGSLAGPALFSAMGATALSPLLASALGSGLAQFAATGDLKKGLVAGLTGYGFGKAFQGLGAIGAENAAMDSAAAAIEGGQSAITSDALGLVRDDPSLLTKLDPNAQVFTADKAADFAALQNAGRTPTVFDPKIVGVKPGGYPITAGSGPKPGDVIGFDQSMGFADINKPIIFQGPQPNTPIMTGPELMTEEAARAFIESQPGGVAFNEAGQTAFDAVTQPSAYEEFIKQQVVPGARDAAMASFSEPMGSFDNVSELYKGAGGAFMKDGRFDFNTGLSSLGKTATSPGVYLPVLGGTALSSYEEPLDQDAEREKRRQELRDLFPEVIPFDEGGPTPGGAAGFRKRAAKKAEEDEDLGMDITPTTLRTTRPIPPIFRPGFQGEMMYFNNLNPTASSLTGLESQQYVNADGEYQIPINETIDQTLLNQKFPSKQRVSYADPAPYVSPNVGIPNVLNPFDAFRQSLMAPVETTDMQEGKDTSLKDLPSAEENPGLRKLPEDVRNKMGYMQSGETTDLVSKEISMQEAEAISNDPMTAELVKFLLGQSSDNTIIDKFVDKYGPEAFRIVRNRALDVVMPNAQNEGMIKGSDRGGMADDIYGTISGQEAVAVSQDEFIVPADVVSMLGDGSSDAGAKKLEGMMDRVRTEKTGTIKQASPINNNVLPA